ncbi:ankyrin repeat domain-containing protein [Thermobifida fusca]|jgi:ankyrin repeat protein|uniref:Ankyrin n=2 Tax=Thermobifida fusca TaxID=2021 RepID=A0A9P2WR31_THEFU|nr:MULTISPECIES: ankyrin repeat domain-containing protein [Thermobifida]AAZ55571.1 ankyrin [Thermobifida fusca YX]EOR71416.1 ankyrin [Thermobifida fusca TM51]MBO2528414.1 ankyrin repeat domain-containing protein [Thermobifida sp.]MDD6792727.1 ankyrin repeat domain-containing protein [Thermobifida fusca]PPS91760.1 ankyrin [Thermobifida fusca]
MESPHAADPEGIDPQVVELATTIFALARAGDTASLDAYIRAGVPANLTNDQGDTLVMLAAYYGHADTVECLCRHGADVNRLNDRGQSPLAGAVFKDEDAVVKTLLAHGADPTLGQPSAIDTARMFGKEHYLELFDNA